MRSLWMVRNQVLRNAPFTDAIGGEKIAVDHGKPNHGFCIPSMHALRLQTLPSPSSSQTHGSKT
jgi:hypothetical protein